MKVKAFSLKLRDDYLLEVSPVTKVGGRVASSYRKGLSAAPKTNIQSSLPSD